MNKYSTNNSMISIEQLCNDYFDKTEVIIPLLQRNYKWSQDDAAKLAEDLWYEYNHGENRYTIGMISMYADKDSDNSLFQLIDGQQRIITLTLLLKYLKPEVKYFNYTFERDNGLQDNIKREYYINNCLEMKNIREEIDYTDNQRFQKNYNAMKVPFTCKDLSYIRKQILNILRNNAVDFDVKKGNITLSQDTDINSLKCFLNKTGIEYDRQSVEIITLLDSYIVSSIVNIIIQNSIFCKIDRENLHKDISKSFSHKSASKNIISANTMKKTEDIAQSIRNCIVSNCESLQDKTLEKDAFFNYIKTKVFILIHISDIKPLDEFLNINKNKMRFVISDYIKAKLILDSKNDGERKRILALYKKFSQILYGNEKVWNLIKRGYECNTLDCKDYESNGDAKYCIHRKECLKVQKNVNRLSVLFSDRYDGNSTLSYDKEWEPEILRHYCLILEQLVYDTDMNRTSVCNYNTYNAFSILYEIANIRFFEMFESRRPDDERGTILEEYLYERFKGNSLNDTLINYYYESQLYSDDSNFNNKVKLPKTIEKSWGNIPEHSEELDLVIQEYITYRKQRIGATDER